VQIATAQDVDPVEVTASAAGDAVPGGVLTATAEVTINDGSTISGYAWMQTSGVPAAVMGADTATAMVTLGSRHEYKDALIEILKEPPIGEDDLPPNVPPPEGEFPGGLQDRYQVVGLNPFSLEEAGLVVLKVTVTTTSGSYSDEVEVHTGLPWKVSTGLENVPAGRTVLLYGKDQADGYDWTLMGPGASSAALVDADTQSPDFTPDVEGMYTVTENVSGTPIVVYAGTWRGIIVGQDENGRPVSDAGCTGCHNPSDFPAPDLFTPWAQTGHAEIFTNNLNMSPYYSENCFSCHTVRFNPAVDNGGVDDAPDYQDFLSGGLLGSPSPDNWTTMLDQYPDSAQLANIQCENCHGPQNGNNHSFNPDDPVHGARKDISSNVCATCHGEPLRHARFQQWQLSGHANYELAIDEGDSGNCSRCHTGNGFLTWLPALEDDDPANNADNIEVTWTLDEVHPQTCATCHDPHNIGTTSGSNTNATVRISDNTPLLLAGFRAVGVGRGAMCMTCHNSRRGLRNDDTFDATTAAGDASRAPHGSVQTDLLMGQNAYLIDVGIRGNHSLVEDSCVKCHMVETPPPDLLAYNQGGTNHTFFAADDVCASCHGPGVTAEGVRAAVEGTLAELKMLQEEAILELMATLIENAPPGQQKRSGVSNSKGKGRGRKGNVIDLNGLALITDINQIVDLDFGEFRGRQSVTVTLADASVVGPLRVNDIDVFDPRGKLMGNLYDFADPRVVKAGWNYNLVHNDASGGIHNPSFSLAAIDAGIDELLRAFAGL
jgi:hypothetical protein